MGALRLYFALAVLRQHCPFVRQLGWISGFTAVCCFFIISGFLIALALDETYRDRTGRFYRNRVLRLGPVYWAVLLLGVIGNEAGLLAQVACCNDVIGVLQSSFDTSWTNRMIALVANITLLPAPLYNALTLFAKDNFPWATLVFGQMYTVGIEMMFYLAAPFLVRLRTPALLALTAAAFVVHVAPALLGHPGRPWQYDFAPGVLVFFLAGIVAHRLYRRLAKTDFPVKFGWLGLAPILIAAVTAGRYGGDFANNEWTLVLYATVVLAIPFVFAASRRARLDTLAGDLSYPLYTVQFLAIAFAMNLGLDEDLQRNYLAPGIAVTGAVLLVFLLERPLRRFRHRKVKASPPTRAASRAAAASAP